MKLSIKKPIEATRAQVEYQETKIGTILLLIAKNINDHLGKRLDDEDGTHKVQFSLGDLSDDAEAFWNEGIEEQVRNGLTEAGWAIKELDIVEAAGGWRFIAKFSNADPNEKSALEQARAHGKAEYHRLKELQRQNR